MAKEILVKVWCDRCTEDGHQSEGMTTPALTVGNAKPRTLDLCEVHRKEILDPLAELLKTLGSVVEAGAAPLAAGPQTGARGLTGRAKVDPRGRITCKVPGCKPRANGSSNFKAFRQHLAYAHDKLTVEDYLGAGYGPIVTDLGVELDAYGHSSDDAEQAASEQLPLGEQLPLADAGAGEYLCGIDGCTKDFADAARPPASLGAHRFRAHGVRGGALAS